MTHSNKGLESIHYLETRSGRRILLGLCEGNWCSGGHRGREKGNGKIVVAELVPESAHDACSWKPIKVIDLPAEIDMTDYAGFAFNGSRVAIVSQEDSTLWVGSFNFDGGRTEPEDYEFAAGGSVLTFPRNSACEIVYCNVEGVHWLDPWRIIVTSDKAKSTQPWRCVAKDQSVHIFAVPR